MGTNLGQHGHVPDLLLMLGGIVKVLESSNAEKKSVKSHYMTKILSGTFLGQHSSVPIL